jgi:hypothetical protein
MESGAEALKRMQEIDNNSGMVAPDVKRLAESEFKNRQSAQSQPLQAPATGALDDKSLAGNMLAQAKRMEIEAKSLISEAAKMKKDAERMFPGVNLSNAAPAPEAAVTPTPAKRGRPSKKVAADAAVQ